MNNTEREILFNFRKEIWNCGKWPVNSHHLNNITYDNYKFIVRSTLVDGLTNFEILKLISAPCSINNFALSSSPFNSA